MKDMEIRGPSKRDFEEVVFAAICAFFGCASLSAECAAGCISLPSLIFLGATLDSANLLCHNPPFSWSLSFPTIRSKCFWDSLLASDLSEVGKIRLGRGIGDEVFCLQLEASCLQLTILAFLLTVGAFLPTVLAFFLTVGALLLTVGKCVSHMGLKGL